MIKIWMKRQKCLKICIRAWNEHENTIRRAWDVHKPTLGPTIGPTMSPSLSSWRMLGDNFITNCTSVFILYVHVQACWLTYPPRPRKPREMGPKDLTLIKNQFG